MEMRVYRKVNWKYWLLGGTRVTEILAYQLSAFTLKTLPKCEAWHLLHFHIPCVSSKPYQVSSMAFCFNLI